MKFFFKLKNLDKLLKSIFIKKKAKKELLNRYFQDQFNWLSKCEEVFGFKNLKNYPKSIDNDIKLKTNRLEMAREKRRGVRIEFQDARIKLIDFKNNRDQLTFKIDSSNETLIELKNRQLDIKKELIESLKEETPILLKRRQSCLRDSQYEA